MKRRKAVKAVLKDRKKIEEETYAIVAAHKRLAALYRDYRAKLDLLTVLLPHNPPPRDPKWEREMEEWCSKMDEL